MTYTASEKLWGKYYKTFEEAISVTNKNIYHYTSSEAMFKIISNKKIWFSNVNCLNDESERKYIYTLLKQCIKSKKLNSMFKEEILKVCEMMESEQEEVCYASTLYNLKNKFIASFSLNSDSLSLWNYYTKTKNMLGYSIDFNLEDFLETTNSTNKYYLYGKVIYEERDQLEILNLMIDDYNEEFCKFLNGDEEVHRSFLISEFIMIIHMFGLFFKHPAYALEQEFRFIYEPSDDIKYRQHFGIFIPYVEISFDMSCIKSIKISPTQKEQLLKTTLIDMLNNIGYQNIDVLNSNIPLRY